MNSKQRVYAALKKKSTDRVPIFMWFHPATTKRFSNLLEIPDESVAEAMGDDVRQAWVNNNYAMGALVLTEGQKQTDFWGIEWTNEDAFNQISKYPLATVSKEELANYKFPNEHVDELLEYMEPIIGLADEYFIGCDVSPCVFEMYWRLVGLERAMMDMAMEPNSAAEMLKRCADFAVLLSEKAFEKFKLDWLWTGDDAGSQQAMLMSPGMWRDLIKPNLKRVYDVAKANDTYVAFHSCGSIRDIIPDLIEIGLDVLNPIQCNCPGMEPLELKKEFGEKIAFMGGVDTQGILPNGTADEVRKATERLITGMTADGGGYILAASHTVPPETPDENIFAMYEVAGITKEQIFDNAAQIRKNCKF